MQTIVWYWFLLLDICYISQYFCAFSSIKAFCNGKTAPVLARNTFWRKLWGHYVIHNNSIWTIAFLIPIYLPWTHEVMSYNYNLFEVTSVISWMLVKVQICTSPCGLLGSEITFGLMSPVALSLSFITRHSQERCIFLLCKLFALCPPKVKKKL